MIRFIFSARNFSLCRSATVRTVIVACWPSVQTRLIVFKPTTPTCIFGGIVNSAKFHFSKYTNNEKGYFIGRLRCIVLVSYLTPEVVSNAAALRRESLPVRRLVCWHVFKLSVSVGRDDVQHTDTPGLTARAQAAAFFSVCRQNSTLAAFVPFEFGSTLRARNVRGDVTKEVHPRTREFLSASPLLLIPSAVRDKFAPWDNGVSRLE